MTNNSIQTLHFSSRVAMGGLRKSRIQFCLQKLAPSNIEAIAKVNYFQTFIFAIMCDMQKSSEFFKLWDGNKNNKPPMSTETHATSLAFNKPLCNYNGSVFIRAPGVSSKRPAASWKAWLALLSVKHPRRAETMRDQCRPASNTQQRINWGYEYVKTHHLNKKIHFLLIKYLISHKNKKTIFHALFIF